MGEGRGGGRGEGGEGGRNGVLLAVLQFHNESDKFLGFNTGSR